MKPDNLRRVDLNLLVTLHVLLEECSVSRAADRLCLSQSAISRSLGRLRDIFSDDLFIRRPHGLQPTTRAVELKSELGDALGMVSRVITPPEFDPATCTKEFTVSVMEHLSMQIIPPLLIRLRKEAPQVKVRVHPWSPHSLNDMGTGKLDVCINILPLERADLHRQIIGPVGGQVLMARHHPYASLEKLTRTQFLAYPHVRLTIAEYEENPFASKIAMLLANREVMLSTSDPHLAFEVVSQSDAMMIGTTFLNKMLVDRYNLQVVALPAEMASLNSQYQLTWHSLVNRDPAHMWFRSLLLDECRALQQQEKMAASCACPFHSEVPRGAA
ncbi:LysR family transcriptional regulator [Sansalvadorimonas verongulae]|uniref:LysR family transcriptional regulator n=1 Tax=Sansalvadorimonas verongulae TaxID=2172824 RepID=UPI0012BD3B0E|nr:LysR family transcriptional regulator [Sansalvadorimonas verongulae]MTI14352.1 LysR family transcriptional regulator [Sansalvadorimonas verongulae]